jgi:hypothetical protein
LLAVAVGNTFPYLFNLNRQILFHAPGQMTANNRSYSLGHVECAIEIVTTHKMVVATSALK